MSIAHSGISLYDYLDNGFVDLPEDFPVQQAILWVELCINNFHKKYPMGVILNLLGKLLKRYSELTEFRNAVANKITKIIHVCVFTYCINDVGSSLDCLEVILVKYGSASLLLKTKISSYLEQFLCSHLNIHIITKAGNGLHFLQQVGSAGKNGLVHKKQWVDHIRILCKTMHTLYDVFFENVKEYINIFGTDVESYDIVLKVYSDNKEIAQRIRNVTIFLNCALFKHYPVERSIPFLTIFNVIKRGLAIDEYSNSTQTDEFLCYLYTLQINLLHLLRVLVVCGTPGIRKYSEEILKLLIDCLKRTDKPYFINKGIFYTSLYDVLNEYISLEKENLNSALCDSILSHNLKYISKVIKSVHHGNTVEENFQTEVLMTITAKNQTLPVVNVKFKEALLMIINLLRNAVLINEDKLHVLYGFAMDQLCNIRNGRGIQPYPKFVTDLYKLLNVLRTMPTYCSLPLLNYTTEYLSSDQFNKNDDVCMQGLEAIENLVNPMYPSLTIIKTNSESIDHNGSFPIEIPVNPINDDLTTNSDYLPSSEFTKLKRDNVITDTINNDPPRKQLKMSTAPDTVNDKLINLSDTNIRSKPLLTTTGDIDNNSKQLLNSAQQDNCITLPDSTYRNVSAENFLQRNSIPNADVDLDKPERKMSSSTSFQEKEKKIQGEITSVQNLLPDSDDDEMSIASKFHDIPNEEFLNI